MLLMLLLLEEGVTRLEISFRGVLVSEVFLLIPDIMVGVYLYILGLDSLSSVSCVSSSNYFLLVFFFIWEGRSGSLQ
jgi:hypothetical protein